MHENLIELLDRSLEQNLEAFGQATPQGTARALPGMPGVSARQRAERWFEVNRTQICENIFSSEISREFFQDGAIKKRAELLAALTDVLSTAFKGYPIALMCVIVVQRGVEDLCPENIAALSVDERKTE